MVEAAAGRGLTLLGHLGGHRLELRADRLAMERAEHEAAAQAAAKVEAERLGREGSKARPNWLSIMA